jgi:hypothetical protein
MRRKTLHYRPTLTTNPAAGQELRTAALRFSTLAVNFRDRPLNRTWHLAASVAVAVPERARALRQPGPGNVEAARAYRLYRRRMYREMVLIFKPT